jgi:lipid-binding SYLF domain-containing protein
MNISRRNAATGLASSAVLTLAAAASAYAASADQLTLDADTALAKLYAAQPKSKTLGNRAVAILVFPRIYKAGFIIGATTGDGALFEGGVPVGFYNTSSASYGLQAGVQAFSLAMFFMNNAALSYLSKSDGWAVGVGPSVVVIDAGMAKSMTTTSLTQDVYAVAFGQQGLMAGIGLEGSKITRIYPGP